MRLLGVPTRSALVLFALTLPVSLAADPPTDVRATLERALAAWDAGDREETLREVERARSALRSGITAIPPGVLRNLDELDEALAVYGLWVRGTRPDLDATHDAVTRVLGGLRLAYRETGRPWSERRFPADFDLDGRVRSLDGLRIEYGPFSDRIDRIGAIELDYEPFSERPRRIGAIEYHWVFDELFEVAGVRIDRR